MASDNSAFNIAYMHIEIAELVWEELTEHQKRHGWKLTRALTIPDLVHDLMAAYDRIADVQPDTTHHESEDN